MTRRFGTWQLFGLLVVASAVLAWAENEFVMTPEVYRNILGSQLGAERIDAQIDMLSRFRGWSYLTIPGMLWLRVAFIALLVQMFCLLGTIEIRFGRLFRIAAIAFISNLVGSANRLVWLVRQEPSAIDAASLGVMPGSIAAFFLETPSGASGFYTVLSQANVFELGWVGLMVLGLTGTRRVGTTGAVLVTGGVWALVTFLQFAIAMYMQHVGA
jgi:hypothetical protein